MLNTKPNILLLASTFRHYFLGLALALEDKQHNYHLIFIDQAYDDERNPTLLAAKQLIRPFQSVSSLPVKNSKNSKKKSREGAFQKLESILNNLKPIEICTGNDRRVEFQYAIYYAQTQISKSTVGSYIEDGTGTYINTQDYNFKKYIADRYIDTSLKKIAYGIWYKHPKYLGASPWISKAYLTFPDLAPYPARVKRIQLNSHILSSQSSMGIINELASILNYRTPDKSEGHVLLVLPHHSLIKSIYGSVTNFREKMKSVIDSAESIYVKYHPRDLNDPFDFESIATILPTAIPAELYLATLNIEHVIGDISTAMMSAKWLNPNCQVSYLPSQSTYSASAEKLFQSINIKPINM